MKPLSRDQVKSVIEGKGHAERIPMMVHFWSHPEVFGGRQEEAMQLLKRYPYDMQAMWFRIPDVYTAPQEDPEYRWVNGDAPVESTQQGLDARVAIRDWKQLDDILDCFPNPQFSGLCAQNQSEDGRYRLGCWWFWLFERHWSLRGMTNALMDYYTDPDQVHRLFRALTDFYLVMLERGKEEFKLDGIFTSDDIGTQTGPFFSLEIFRKFFKPYYKELIDRAHSLGMHFWLHTCGNIEAFLPDLIEIGLDVIHPIQKYTMKEKTIAEKYGKDICLWTGFDVQRIIPWGTPEEVRQEVRFMMDTYYRPEGRFMLTAGNGITSDCTVGSLEALLDESWRYGKQKASMDI